MKNKWDKVKIIVSYILIIIIILIVTYGTYKVISTNDVNNYGDKALYKATFQLNGATSIEIKELVCEYTDNDCIIKLPVALRDKGIVLGYNLDASNNISYQIGDNVIMTSDITFYVVSKRDLTLTIDDSNIDTIATNHVSCSLYNNDTNCEVKLPFFNKIGYENRGYSTNQDSISGFIFPNSNYTLYRDVIIYPVANTFTRNTAISVNKVLSIDNLIIEVENGCNSNVAEKLIGYIRSIKKNVPYLIVDSKVSLLNPTTFNKIWGLNYVGMNYGPTYQRIIDVRCASDTNNYYATIIHEAAHTWDFYYASLFKKTITEEADVINLYSKYQNISDRPFREYSYTSIKEFFADMVRYYYLKYIDYDSFYGQLNYPDDIKNVLEKYMCMASNSYDKTKCGD